MLGSRCKKSACSTTIRPTLCTATSKQPSKRHCTSNIARKESPQRWGLAVHRKISTQTENALPFATFNTRQLPPPCSSAQSLPTTKARGNASFPHQKQHTSLQVSRNVYTTGIAAVQPQLLPPHGCIARRATPHRRRRGLVAGWRWGAHRPAPPGPPTQWAGSCKWAGGRLATMRCKHVAGSRKLLWLLLARGPSSCNKALWHTHAHLRGGEGRREGRWQGSM
jgi:hypothetical protein